MESNIKLLRHSSIIFIFLSIIPVTNYEVFIYLLAIVKNISMTLLIVVILFIEYIKMLKILKKDTKFKMLK